MTQLADVIATLRPTTSMRVGIVVATSTGRVDIKLGDSTITGVPVLRGSGSWSAGNRAVVLIDHRRVVAVGAIAATTTSDQPDEPGNTGPVPPNLNPSPVPETSDPSSPEEN